MQFRGDSSDGNRGRILLALLALIAIAAAAGVIGLVLSCPRSGPSAAGPVPPGAGPGDFYFQEVSETAGVNIRTICGRDRGKKWIMESNGSGAGLFDYDGDGDLDIYIVNGSTEAIIRGLDDPVRNGLFRNDGDWTFVDVTEEAGVGHTGWGYGCAVGDIDNDGDLDLFVTNYGPNVLYENQGDGTFKDITESAGVGDDGWGESCGFGDIDNDGDLDLYVANKIVFDLDNPPFNGELCNIGGLHVVCGPRGLTAQPDRLYRNEGGGKFADISDSSGIHEPEPHYGLGVLFLDYDDDGLVDIYVANDSVPNFLFQNLGDAKFKEVAKLKGVASKDEGTPQAGMGVTFGDCNGDGFVDIVVTNFAGDYNTLYLGEDGIFTDVTYSYGMGQETWKDLSWGTMFADFDNDGDLDNYTANGHVYPEVDDGGRGETFRQADHLFLNEGDEGFKLISKRIRLQGEPRSSRGAAFGDLDNDGDIDGVIVEMGERPTILRNEGGNQGNWIRVALRGRESNREGIGAKIWITVDGVRQRRDVTRCQSYCSSNDVRAHFGVGTAQRLEKLEILWPSGKTLTREDLPVNQDHLFDEKDSDP